MADGGHMPGLQGSDFLNTIRTTQNMDDFKYKMDHKYRGLAIIFNQIEYSEKIAPTRVGTKADVNSLKEALIGLGFKSDHIIENVDYTKDDIFKFVNTIKSTEYEYSSVLKDCDCIAIFVLTYGTRDNTVFAHDDTYNIYDLIEKFTSKNFPKLATKPKLLFIQACGDIKSLAGKSYLQSAPKLDETSEVQHKVQESKQFTEKSIDHPEYADFFIGLSSHPNAVSFRNPKTISSYIQAICISIQSFVHVGQLETTEITDIITYAQELVSERTENGDDNEEENNKKQSPCFINALCRQLYFLNNKNKT